MTDMAPPVEYQNPNDSATFGRDFASPWKADDPAILNTDPSYSKGRGIAAFATGALSAVGLQPLLAKLMGIKRKPMDLKRMLMLGTLAGGSATGLDFLREKLRAAVDKPRQKKASVLDSVKLGAPVAGAALPSPGNPIKGTPGAPVTTGKPPMQPGAAPITGTAGAQAAQATAGVGPKMWAGAGTPFKVQSQPPQPPAQPQPQPQPAVPARRTPRVQADSMLRAVGETGGDPTIQRGLVASRNKMTELEHAQNLKTRFAQPWETVAKGIGTQHLPRAQQAHNDLQVALQTGDKALYNQARAKLESYAKTVSPSEVARRNLQQQAAAGDPHALAALKHIESLQGGFWGDQSKRKWWGGKKDPVELLQGRQAKQEKLLGGLAPAESKLAPATINLPRESSMMGGLTDMFGGNKGLAGMAMLSALTGNQGFANMAMMPMLMQMLQSQQGGNRQQGGDRQTRNAA